MKPTVKSVLLTAIVALTPGAVDAQTAHGLCLRIPVTVGDTTGQANDLGTTGAWKARGMQIRVLSGTAGSEIVPWTYSVASTGCIIVPTTSNGPFLIQYRPRGLLATDLLLPLRRLVNPGKASV